MECIKLFGLSMLASLATAESAEASILGIKVGKSILFASKAVLSKVAATVVVSVAIASEMVMYKSYKEKNISIEYNNRPTNESINVSINIDNIDKNDNVKVISSNNEEIATNKTDEKTFLAIIESNGTYNVMMNDEILSTININNIDREYPIIKEYKTDGNILEVYLSDNLSGIDYDKLEVISENDEKINSINIDKEANKIEIELNTGIKYLKIVDNVGNLSVYKKE